MSSDQYIVGTPEKAVTFSLIIVSMTALGSKRGRSTIVEPLNRNAFIWTVWANEWNSGRATSDTTPSRGSNGSAISREIIALVSILLWVSSAPLGLPVVPDVYRMTAVSSGARTLVSNVGGC